MIYRPREDSFLLKEFVDTLDLNNKRFLEMGAGEAVAGLCAHRKGAKVTLADIDEEVVRELEGSMPEDISVIKSDLFENISEKFDVIVFNPPYLSGERKDESDPLVGGEKGIEIIERFLAGAEQYIVEGGAVYVIMSSEAEIAETVESFNLEKVDERKLWFEKLYVMKSG